MLLLSRRAEAPAELHRARVRDELTARSAGWVIVDPDGPTADCAAVTIAACAAGAQRIWGAVLPSEADTGRRGKVEILLRDDERGGYIPVIVVNHKVTDPRNSEIEGGAVTSGLDAWSPREDPARKARPQSRDQMRLAHLYRMLQRHGYASPAVVGPWWSRCATWLTDARDVSLVATGARADVLRASNVNTVDELAMWTGEAPSDWQFGNFEDAIVTAKAWLKDVPLVRRHEHVRVQRADVEVDVDLESYQESGAYLWGTLLDGQYRPFVTWDPLPTADEGRSFGEFWTWLSSVRRDAAANGKTFAAYCYSRRAEDKWLLDSARRFGGQPGVPSVDEVRAFIDGPDWVDMYEAVTDEFVCPNGKGLKKIAPVAGFTWRDPEAGGEASMAWYREAVGYDGEPDLTQRTRLLEYNEDDVTAAGREIPHLTDL